MFVGFIQHIQAEYKISQFTKCPATCFIKLSSDSEFKTEYPAVNILHFKNSLVPRTAGFVYCRAGTPQPEQGQTGQLQ
jgi:hypothetical protein